MTEVPKISGPADDALDVAGLTTLEKVARTPRDEVAALHGMSPKGIRILTDAIAKAGLDPWKVGRLMAPIAEAMARTGKGTEASAPAGSQQPIAWETAIDRFRKGGWFWLATVRPDGSPHAMPLFAAWGGSSFFVASKATKRKSRNLDANPRCVLTHDADDLHLIVEGEARRVRDEAGLKRATDAFASVYDWPTTVAGDELDAPYAAPTSGGAPFNVYEITPKLAFGFPTDGETFTPTRWRF